MDDAPKTEMRPLCVDLDGTLVKTDTFAQALLLLVRKRPSLLFSLPRWALGGLAAVKRKVAQQIQLDPAALPYHPGLLTFLNSEKEKGRTLILVTASDEIPAGAVATHLRLFSDVMASDGQSNLKAERKRDALVARFGVKGFDYAGNAKDDLPVWEAADGMIAVNPSASARRALKGRSSTRIFEERPLRIKSWVRALRLHQWTKNILVFLPMMLAHQWNDSALLANGIIAFLAFSLAASTIYLCNDLLDLHADQHHPRKKGRPFAAGNLSLLSAAVALPLLLVSAVLLSLQLPATFAGVLVLYLVMNVLYSCWLKQTALLDVLTLAGFYALRIFAGTAAYGVPSSEWLIAFSLFIFFSLALVKRYSELREAAETTPNVLKVRGRGYRAADMPLVGSFGVASGCLAVLVLALYINSAKVTEFYHSPAMLWMLCPLMFYWIARLWLLAGRGELSDDPLSFAVRDPHTWLIGILSATVLVLGSW